MPAVVSGKILVTGANGFIGVWTVKYFLDAGYSVRAAVRSASKAEHLKTTFSSYADKFEIALVPDMLAEGAFDQAVLGVDAIVHTASPVHLHADEPSEMLDPAVNGTLNVLRSAALAPGVRRVLYVSSCAAVYTRNAPARVYDETCWNDADAHAVATLGRAADVHAKYSASKIGAERAAWAFYAERKDAAPGLPWDLVVVNPPWVFGPVLHEVRGGPEGLNDSNRLFFDAVMKGLYTVPANCYVDVRDLALAFILAIQKPEAADQRIIVSQGKFKWEDFAVAAGKISSKVPPLNAPYDASTAEHTIIYNNAKSKELLGITYRTLEETTADILKDWEAREWL